MMGMARLSALFLVLLPFLVSCHAAAKDLDIGRDMVSIVESRGYSIERHFATTPDGYVLGMFRMPRGKAEGNASTNGKPVVYLNHALLDSSWAFVCNGPGMSLGFILADAGYDVWFGNNRGNVYSTNHTTLSVDSAEFWNFSFDEMALVDLPTHIEYVLGATGAKSLSYIGHSQGSIQAFAGFSRNQTLAAKVDLFIAMAPVVFVHHQESLILKLMFSLGADMVFQLLGVRQFLTTKTGITKLGSWICGRTPGICDDVLELIVGPGHHLNKTRIDVFVSETPAGTSVKNMVHWGQGMRSEVFQMYDYGPTGNMAQYNQTEPPQYHLGDLQVPIALLTGGLDYLADPQDVSALIAALPPKVLRKHMNLPDYAHLDFTWAQDAHVFLYPEILQLLAATHQTVDIFV
mmetsp:Transcript_91962/g.297506  ORF Transcript_91962/g.297506 Transcript_91962/m.297506 type:complete len:404 (+) Transcript_91962:72-1283(+)